MKDPIQKLWACALELERRHGTGAFHVAARRADMLEAEGAFEDAQAWRAILRRIEALEGADCARLQ